MRRDYLALVGYGFILLGFISLILGLIGLQLSPIAFLDRWFGPIGSLLVKLLLLVFGMILFYISRIPEEE